jgi:hypothetical protein
MRAPTVVAISAMAHAALFAGLSQVVIPQLAPVPVHTMVGSTAEPEPIEVIVLSEPAPTESRIPASTHVAAAATAHVGTPPRRRDAVAIASTETASIAASATTAVIETGPSPETGSGATPPGLMHMRARGTGLDISPEIAARIPGRPYVAPAEPKVSGKLENTPGGGAVVHDAVTTMSIERDGNIKFADKPDIDLHFHLPIPDLDPEEIRKDIGRDLTEWFKDPYAATKFGRKAEVSRVWMAVPGACDSYGDVWCDDEMAPKEEKEARQQEKTGGSIFGGNADISAYLQRKFVGDPYASRKLKLLDDTRDERVARGGAFRSQQLVRSAELMRRTLEQLWAYELDPAKRRAALFELWDDCDEGDGERGQAGQRARAMILGWIGARLPRGSAGAFTDDEISRLESRRSSKQAFAPYPEAPPNPGVYAPR